MPLKAFGDTVRRSRRTLRRTYSQQSGLHILCPPKDESAS